ncbi:MAG TPA: hypothetical protein VEL07_18285 [Planctomycetota bacterium]|nr:hypothetical protein [Planctomycetota bacterium]
MTNAATSPNPMREKAQEIKDNIVEMTGMVRDAARDKLCDAKDGAAARLRSGVDQAGRARDSVVDLAKANPTATVLACLCAGALAGFFIARRR